MQPKLTYQIVGVSVLKFEFEGGTHYVRFRILFLCAIAANNFVQERIQICCGLLIILLLSFSG